MAESIRTIREFVPTHRSLISAEGPTTREWIKHTGLLLITFLTTTFAGILLAAPDVDVPERSTPGVLGYILYVPDYYFRLVSKVAGLAFSSPDLLLSGIAFSTALLTILLAHEMGHYLACRLYRVNATLPFFIPAPPLFLAGTFGAFIKMKSPIPSRRALFDIGLAGPLAGFVALIPIAWAGLFNLQRATVSGPAVITFNDPLLFRMMAKVIGVSLLDAAPNPFYMAAWIGLLVTSLNLMPVGQLDGGHGTFAIFGQRAHKWIGKIAFVIVALVSILGFIWHGSPSGFLYTVLLGVMLRVRHPAPQHYEPLGTARAIVAVITLLVFAFSFVPFPITIS